jgi:hypothetical protein
MATTFTKIANVTVGAGGSTTINFTSIPSTYTDLCILSSIRTDRPTYNAENVLVEFNGVTTNYGVKWLETDSTTIGNVTSNIFPIASASTSISSASVFANSIAYIPNYTSSNYKSAYVDGVTENNGTSGYLYLYAPLWTATPAAISSIAIKSGVSSTMQQYSTATLYGIKKS